VGGSYRPPAARVKVLERPPIYGIVHPFLSITGEALGDNE
jgi:hypothetical protein